MGSTARDFRWSSHALVRARQRLGWERVPAARVVRTEMRSHRGSEVWVGQTFALLVERGTVCTCFGAREARRGHWKSPAFDPAAEFARLAGV